MVGLYIICKYFEELDRFVIVISTHEKYQYNNKYNSLASQHILVRQPKFILEAISDHIKCLHLPNNNN